MNFRKRAEEIREFIVEKRRHIHQHPELSFHEQETTAYLSAELAKMGIPVQRFADYTGCIATIKGGKPGKATVLLRADIDALPIQEKSGVPFASVNSGVMHACGHDCHTTMLLGAAKLLSEKRDELCGTVKLLFQAAEEQYIGSYYYVDKGYLTGVDAAMGMHVWPSSPSGKLVVKDGPLMAGCNNFRITVHGVAAHGSTPHLGKDAIVAASAIILNAQTIVSRLNNPLNTLVVSIGTIHAGSQYNIIADTATMEGTMRFFSAKTGEMAMKAMEAIVQKTAAMLGCTAEVEFPVNELPVINSDIAVNEIARKAASKLFGREVLVDAPPVTGSEDFAYIMNYIPASLFVFLGCYDEEVGAVYPVHTETFKVNENILPVGAAMYAQFAADYLESKREAEL